MSHFLHIHGLLQLHQRPSLLETTPFPLPHSPNCALVDQVNPATPPHPGPRRPCFYEEACLHVFTAAAACGTPASALPLLSTLWTGCSFRKIVAPPSAVGQKVGGGVGESRELLLWISHAPCKKLPRGTPHNSTACCEDPPSSPQHAVCSGASLVINTTCPRVSLNSLLLTTHSATGDCKKGK